VATVTCAIGGREKLDQDVGTSTVSIVREANRDSSRLLVSASNVVSVLPIRLTYAMNVGTTGLTRQPPDAKDNRSNQISHSSVV
jgi:hypothetical protein